MFQTLTNPNHSHVVTRRVMREIRAQRHMTATELGARMRRRDDPNP